MSVHLSYSEQTVLKALQWLDKQPHNWANHITDTNIAVKMYLKSQKKQEWHSPFAKEIKKIIGAEKTENLNPQEEPTGAFLIKQPLPSLNVLQQSVLQKQTSSPANFHSNKASCNKEEEDFFPEERKKQSFVLDEKSLQALEEVKKEFNIEKEEEALRFLIQFAQKSLKKFFSASS